jgi:hypothetical protein
VRSEDYAYRLTAILLASYPASRLSPRSGPYAEKPRSTRGYPIFAIPALLLDLTQTCELSGGS